MQPYNQKGRKTRLALIPISWIVAFAILYLLMAVLAQINGSSIKALLQKDSYWILAVFIPGLLFGKVLGLITINFLAFVTPPLRRIFEEEVSETGRHGFLQAMKGLGKAALLLGVITLIGTIIFLKQMKM